jgi:hypothetical protein
MRGGEQLTQSEEVVVQARDAFDVVWRLMVSDVEVRLGSVVADGVECFPTVMIPVWSPAIESQVYALEIRGEGWVRSNDVDEKPADAFQAFVFEGVGRIADFL